jgi:hypothetical protein
MRSGCLFSARRHEVHQAAPVPVKAVCATIRLVADRPQQGRVLNCRQIHQISALQLTVIASSERIVHGPFLMLKFRKGFGCFEKTMTENTVMMNNVIAWPIGLRKNDGHCTKDFGEHICKEALQFVDEQTYFELACVQLVKHAPRVFCVFAALAKHYVLFKGGN